MTHVRNEFKLVQLGQCEKNFQPYFYVLTKWEQSDVNYQHFRYIYIYTVYTGC